MSFRTSLTVALGSAVLSIASIGFTACGGGGGGGSSGTNTISTALQDLTADPEGMTTVVAFASTHGLAGATAANFQADGGQTAQSVLVSGSHATVVWNLRVTPSDRVRAVNLSGVDGSYHAVTTSDPAAPTFVVTSATQNPGLGGDTITLTFSGAHLVQSEAEALATWSITTGGNALDLTGSTFALTPATQTIAVTLGTNANLHATFTIAAANLHSVADVLVSPVAVNGNASGDVTAPTLQSSIQNLGQDPYGRVIDFTFNKAMDPVSSLGLAHYVVTLPDLATSVSQPFENLLRVTFNNPIVPGFDTVSLQGLTDLHGNALPNGPHAITQPSPVVNAFSGNVQAVSVANAGGDYVTATTTQAFDPDSATLPASWSLTVAGTPVDLTQQTLSYDFIGKTLRIDLAFDLVNGQSFTLQGVNTRDVDGQAFNLSQTHLVSGDANAPTITGAIQNRSVDSAGTTVDVQMSEDVDVASAENLANWAASGAQNVVGATLMPGLDLVRLVFDAPMIPGDVTISGQNVADLAGNVMVPQAGVSLVSTDTTPPSVVSYQANATEGANNDVVELVFDDDLIVAEVSDTSKWTLESPVGTPCTTAGATVLYDASVRRARLKLENGVNLHRDDDFKVTLTGVRDLGGNVGAPTPHVGQVISESSLPAVATVWRPTANPDQLEVRFSEPCDLLTDLYDATTNPAGTRYVLRNSGGLQRGLASAATAVDSGLGVRVSFGIVVAPTDTIDVIGPTDLAGNPLFPALFVTTVAEDPSPPALAPGLSTFDSVSGEDNDSFTVHFDRPVSPWTITDHVHYTPSGPTTVVKRTRELTWNGVDTVTVPLRSNGTEYDLLTGSGYDLLVDGIQSAQGVPIAGPQTETGILVSGDSTPPDVPAGKVRIDPATANSLLVEFTEAVGYPSATNPASYAYDVVNAPTAASLVNPRVVRLTFSVTPLVGHALALNVADRAGNSSGALSRTVSAADSTGPLVSSVDGLLRPGYGGDEVHVFFDEPVTLATALSPANYSLQCGGVPRSLVGASFSYSSPTNRVTIKLPGGQDLTAGASITVGVSGVKDVSGNVMAAALQVGGTTTGDLVPPDFAKAYVDWRADSSGKVVEVLFTEDVDTAFVTNVANWSASGPSSVSSIAIRERNHYRVTLSSGLAGGGSFQMTGLPDVAGNLSGPISIVPVQ